MINGKLISRPSERYEVYYLDAQDIHYDPQNGRMVGYGLHVLMYWLDSISRQTIAATINMLNEICKHGELVNNLRIYVNEIIYVTYLHGYIYREDHLSGDDNLQIIMDCDQVEYLLEQYRIYLDEYRKDKGRKYLPPIDIEYIAEGPEAIKILIEKKQNYNTVK